MIRNLNLDNNWNRLASNPALRTLTEQDPKGHSLIALRMNAIRELAKEFIKAKCGEFNPLADNNIHIAGTGSSLAHAQYLSHLLELFHNRTSRVIDPLEISQNYGVERLRRFDNLMVFSQGLSPNTHAAVASLQNAENGVLFTAASENGLKQKPDRLALLKTLSDTTQAMRFPLENEFEVLPRFIGPFIGYLAVYKYATEGLGAVDAPSVRDLDLDALFDSAQKTGEDAVERIKNLKLNESAIHIVATMPTADFAFNLKEKFRECLLPQGGVELSSITGYEHGRMQHAAATKGISFVLTQKDRTASEETVVRNRIAQSMEARLSSVILESPTNPIFSILWHEMVLNFVLLKEVEKSNIDLANWPGKEFDRYGNYNFTGM